MSNYQEKYEALLKEFEQYKKESIKWSVEDFTYYEHDSYTITPEQAQEALERMIQKHDAEIGINWNVVEYYLCEYGTKKPKYEKINVSFNDEGREITFIISPSSPDEWWSEQGYDIHYCEDYNQISVYKSDNNYITIHKQKINNYGESL